MWTDNRLSHHSQQHTHTHDTLLLEHPVHKNDGRKTDEGREMMDM